MAEFQSATPRLRSETLQGRVSDLRPRVEGDENAPKALVPLHS